MNESLKVIVRFKVFLGWPGSGGRSEGTDQHEILLALRADNQSEFAAAVKEMMVAYGFTVHFIESLFRKTHRPLTSSLPLSFRMRKANAAWRSCREEGCAPVDGSAAGSMRAPCKKLNF